MGTSAYRKDHALQLSVGSRWMDQQGNTFVVDAIGNNGTETWVAYYRTDTNIHYRCLAEAFTYRFTLLTQ